MTESVCVLLELELLWAGFPLKLGVDELLEESIASAELAVARDEALVVGASIDESPGNS